MKETETDGKLEEISEATSERIPKSSIDRVFKKYPKYFVYISYI